MRDNDTVVDLIHEGRWMWPNEWLGLYPSLNQITIPVPSDRKDSVVWIDYQNKEVEFSVKIAWKSLRDKWPIVNWNHVAWFSQCTPKHAFILWMAIYKKLLTQDRMMVWQQRVDLKCLLCKRCLDSHNHLFFECPYAAHVWKEVPRKGKFERDCKSLDDIVNIMAAQKSKNSIWLIEVDISHKKDRNRAKMTKWAGMEKNVKKSRPKTKKSQSQSQFQKEESTVKRSGMKNTKLMQSQPIWMGRDGKPNSIIMKTVERPMGPSNSITAAH
ncbi:RNA-directed DNA polymerase, eukaryota, reverse transcriptase zinc-binding domain protein [Tanacetum coccineum]